MSTSTNRRSRTHRAIPAPATVNSTCGPQKIPSRPNSGQNSLRGARGPETARRLIGDARAPVRSVPSCEWSQSRSRLDVRTIIGVLGDILKFASSMLLPRARLAAENLFLRKQLALYVERGVKPRRADDATRLTLVGLSRLIDWRQLLIVVKPETLIRWHRKGFRLFWRWKSRSHGRPRVPANVQQLIAEMAAANRTWGEERIASELLVKLRIRVSPRTVRRYMPSGSPDAGSRRRPGSQRWSAFVRNHARSVLACDFFVTVTAGFRMLYVFVVLDVGTRRILHWNVTDHPTAEWTAQQFRMVVTGEPTASICGPRPRQHLFGGC